MIRSTLFTAIVLAAMTSSYTASRVGAEPTLYSANGHYYEWVNGNYSWDSARVAAASRTYNGLTGHLVTITSAEENAFVTSILPNIDYGQWTGGRTTGGWITGEAMTYFNWRPGASHSGCIALCTNQAGNYSSYPKGSWNAQSGSIATLQYVVEYEPAIPAFTIVSATFDASCYQNGSETAHLTVVTKSNWGTGAVTLGGSVTRQDNQTTQMSSDTFSLSAGQQHQSVLAVVAPSCSVPQDFTASVSLTQSGTTVASWNGAGFTGTPLTQVQIDQQMQELRACEVVPGSGGRMMSAVLSITSIGRLVGPISPVAGLIGSAVGIKQAICKSAVYRRYGDECRENATNFLLGVGAVGLGLSGALAILGPGITGVAIGPVLGTTSLVLTALGPAWIETRCGSAGMASLAARDTTGMVVGQGDEVRRIMTYIADVGDSLETTFSTHIGVEGPGQVRLRMPCGWISTDSTAIDESGAFVIAPDTLQWLTVGTRASRFAAGFDTTVAPVDSLWPKRLTVSATKAGNIAVGLAMRQVGSWQTAYLMYPTVAVTASTRMWVTFEAHARAYPILIDHDGDGDVDARVFPQGVTTPAPDLPIVTTPRLHQNQPNPFNPRTVITYELPTADPVRLTIYDAKGRLVRHLVDSGAQVAGRHEAVWDGRSDDGVAKSSGVYFCRLEAGDYVQTIKLALLK